MGMRLTADEVHALESIKNTPARGIDTAPGPTASKRLVELGFARRGIGDHLTITEIGRNALFLRHCFSELVAFDANPKLIIQLECEGWLCKSGYVQRKSFKEQMHFFDFEITQKGRDWIAEFNSGDS